MIEQYIFNRITADATLSALLDAGSGKIHLYPSVVPRGIDIAEAVTFTRITTTDVYPAANSCVVQFNIFTDTHTKGVQIAQALADIFNEDNNQSSGGVDVVFSIRNSETELGFDFDDKTYQRQCSYYFKLR